MKTIQIPYTQEAQRKSTPPLTGCILASLLLFMYASPLLRKLDPLAAVLDLGIISILFFSLLAYLTFIAISHWLLDILWPAFRTFYQQDFTHTFQKLPSWQKIIIYLISYFLLLYACIILLAALL